MNHPDLEALLSPGPDEEAHLADCPRCRLDVRLASPSLATPPGLEAARERMTEARTRGRQTYASSLYLEQESDTGPQYDLYDGEVVAGRYAAEAFLGRGGMASVYRVRHLQLGSLHALKILHLPTRSIRERLMREGRAQASANHPNIVPVTDVVDVHGCPGLVMRYIDGVSLRRLFALMAPLELPHARRLAIDLLKGVRAAHALDLVHRDLKPGNILVDLAHEPRALVADFGLAKVVSEDPGAALSRSGTPMGTPGYMAPEQIRDAKHVDERADVWALGIILYELYTGRRPVHWTGFVEFMAAVDAMEIRPPRSCRAEVPEAVDQAILAALKTDPDERTVTVQQLLDAVSSSGSVEPVWLEDELQSLRSQTGGAPLDEPAPRSEETVAEEETLAPQPSSRRWIAVAALAALVAAGGLFTLLEPEGPVRTPNRVTLAEDSQTAYHFPSISPDGGEVAYTDMTDIWVRLVDQDGVRNLTEDFEPNAIQPAYSPDGSQIAFVGDGDLYVTDRFGSRPRNLMVRGYDPAWSPDGTQIAYSSAYVLDPFMRPVEPGRLGVVDVRSGEHRVLVDTIEAVQPAWSPDGERIAFMSEDTWIWTVRPDGSDVVRSGAFGWSPGWSEGGERLVSIRESGSVQALWDKITSTETGLSSDEDSRFLVEIPHYPLHADVGPGARWVASTVSSYASIRAIDLDPETGRPAQLTLPELVTDLGEPRWVSLSPDGTRLVTSAYDDDDLWSHAVDGSDRERLSEAWNAKWPTWSSDGFVYYWDSRNDGGIYRTRPDGSAHGLVVPDAFSPFVSRDGSLLGVTRRAGTRVETALLATDTWAELQVRAGWTGDDFSPSGAQVLLQRDGETAIWDRETDTLRVLEGDFVDGVWLSETVLLAADGHDVLRVDLSTVPEQATTIVDLAPLQVLEQHGLDLSPDGDRLFVSGYVSRGSVMLIEWE